MTSLSTIYDAFLCKIKEDDWSHCHSEEELEYYLKDWRSILDSSLPYFRFPRCKLEIDEELQAFTDPKFGSVEVEILAVFMKQEWLKRSIDTWENIKTQYAESDFSQANLLKEFISLRTQVKDEADLLERSYYRSVDKKPYKYRKLAGGKR